MPWQRYVADVALEYDPDTGRLCYRRVGLTVPRQSGKTTLILALAVDRALGFGGRQNIVYTAQTRNDARLKWEEEHVESLNGSIFRPLFRVKLANGQEAIRWRNGSRHGITAGTEKSGHGATLDLGFVDEAFAQVDARSEQSMNPAMITRPEPQMWVVSTAGTESSTYLRDKVEDGRERTLAADPGPVAYFEWSAPDDADPADPAVWWACMPALGHTVTEDAIRAEYESMRRKQLAEFQRAYLNQWVDRSVRDQVVPESWWRQCADRESAISGPVVFTTDVAPGDGWASIAVAGLRRDGLPHGEVTDHHRNSDWVVARLVELRGRHEMVCDLALDPAGPVGSLLPALRAEGFDPILLTARDQAQSCGGLFTKSKSSAWRHLAQPELDAALRSAAKRDLGDAWALTRRKSGGDISPLVAVAEALWALETFGGAAYEVLDSVW